MSMLINTRYENKTAPMILIRETTKQGVQSLSNVFRTSYALDQVVDRPSMSLARRLWLPTSPYRHRGHWRAINVKLIFSINTDIGG